MSAVVEIKNRPLISEEEKAKRKKEIDFARGCVRYEGVVLDDEIEALNQQYINGELTSEEFNAAFEKLMNGRYEQWKMKQKS